MHFLLLVLQCVLDRLIPAWRDSLQLAARADGRLEHVPTSGMWNRWLGRKEHNRPRLARTALAVRALCVLPLAPGDALAKSPEPRK
jgi:hypothetical protein